MKSLVFDLGGVLLPLDNDRCVLSFRRLLGDNFDTLGLGPDAEGVRLMADYERGLVSSDYFVGYISGLCVKRVPGTVIKEAWNSMLTSIPSERLEFISGLRRSGYRTFLLSNTNDLHWRYVLDKHPDLTGCFEDIFLSYELHVAKPEREIFLALTERTGIVPEEILFVDDLDANRKSAESCGWKTFPDICSLRAFMVTGASRP